MDDKEMRLELEARMTKLAKNFAGMQIDQTFITRIWVATFDEIKNFNEEFMRLPHVAIEWIHAQYVNRVIKLEVGKGNIMTLGELTTQGNSPKINKIALVDLYRMRKVFQNSLLESDIVAEIEGRLNDGKTDKQTSRGDFSTDN